MRRLLTCLAIGSIAFGSRPWSQGREASKKSPLVVARRLSQNPLITTRSSASLGDNINGPTVIRVPAWVAHPLGRYYMYFAHHMGTFIRLSYADRIEGLRQINEPGVMDVSSTE